ncbi:VOC family protein [Chloroflexota bacterium]
MLSYRHNHTQITTKDTEKAVEFYTQVMNAKITRTQGSGNQQTVDLDLGGIPVRVSSKTGADDALGKRYGLHHIAFNVNDMEESIGNAKSKGVEIVVEFQPRPGVKIAFIKGPDDALFEILEVKES